MRCALGIFGGSGGPGCLHIMHQGSGLKIWASWEIVNHVTPPPTFAGAATIAMAREVYGIADSTDNPSYSSDGRLGYGSRRSDEAIREMSDKGSTLFALAGRREKEYRERPRMTCLARNS